MQNQIRPVNKQALYSSISSHASDVVKRLVELSGSKNENVALGACKILLNKALPDIKTVEFNQINVQDNKASEKVMEDTRTSEEVAVELKQRLERLQLAYEAITRTGRYADDRGKVGL